MRFSQHAVTVSQGLAPSQQHPPAPRARPHLSAKRGVPLCQNQGVCVQHKESWVSRGCIYCSGQGFWLMSGRTWTSWKPRRNLLSSDTILPWRKGQIPKIGDMPQLPSWSTHTIPVWHVRLPLLVHPVDLPADKHPDPAFSPPLLAPQEVGDEQRQPCGTRPRSPRGVFNLLPPSSIACSHSMGQGSPPLSKSQ